VGPTTKVMKEFYDNDQMGPFTVAGWVHPSSVVAKWAGFPSTRKEFEGYHSFKTHDLDVLLHLTGIEGRIKTQLFAEWSAVAAWDPESSVTLLRTSP